MTLPRTLSILLAAVALSVLFSPVQRELYVGDETKYAQVVREVRAGSWFLPTLHGKPFTHKPPVHFWMIGALTYPLGLYSTWAFVLPSIIAFFFLLWLMWKMEGPLAAFICGTSLMIWGSAQTARMDVSFTALITLGAYLMRRGALVWSGVVFGVATLIKGPMAPVIAILLFAFSRVPKPKPRALLGLLLMAAIPLLWFLPATQIGGSSYTEDVLVKQTAGRAVGAWVHKAAPWFYIVHAPADLFPWFFLFVIAIFKLRDPESKFYIAWILAVFIPYSLLSSKLDVYMMTLIPAVAALIARMDHSAVWAWRANILAIGLLIGVGIAGYFVAPPEAKMLCIVLAVAAVIAFILAMRWRDVRATLLVGLTPLVALLYAAIAVVPVANEMASTRPAIRALVKQNVPPEQIALFTAPQLWTRDMPRDLERVQYIDKGDPLPTVVLTSRRYAKDLNLSGHRLVDSFQMIGKWFDVYRR